MVLGVEIYRNQEMRMLTLCQSGSLRKTIERFCLESVRFQTMFMDDNVRLMQDAEPYMEQYREAIWCIMYFMVSPLHNLSYSVCTPVRLVESPGAIHCGRVTSVKIHFEHNALWFETGLAIL